MIYILHIYISKYIYEVKKTKVQGEGLNEIWWHCFRCRLIRAWTKEVFMEIEAENQMQILSINY